VGARCLRRVQRGVSLTRAALSGRWPKSMTDCPYRVSLQGLHMRARATSGEKYGRRHRRHLCQPMRRMTLGGVRSWSMIASRRTPPSNGHSFTSEKPWPSSRLNGTARGLTTCGLGRLGAGVGRGNGVVAACAGAGAPLRSF
jgi:hypothetical protein